MLFFFLVSWSNLPKFFVCFCFISFTEITRFWFLWSSSVFYFNYFYSYVYYFLSCTFLGYTLLCSYLFFLPPVLKAFISSHLSFLIYKNVDIFQNTILVAYLRFYHSLIFLCSILKYFPIAILIYSLIYKLFKIIF